MPCSILSNLLAQLEEALARMTMYEQYENHTLDNSTRAGRRSLVMKKGGLYEAGKPTSTDLRRTRSNCNSEVEGMMKDISEKIGQAIQDAIANGGNQFISRISATIKEGS